MYRIIQFKAIQQLVEHKIILTASLSFLENGFRMMIKFEKKLWKKNKGCVTENVHFFKDSDYPSWP